MLPKRFPDRAAIADVRAEAEHGRARRARARSTHRIAGRVMARRDMGKLVFLDLVDRSGRIQLLVQPERTGEIDVDLGDVVGVAGRAGEEPRAASRASPSTSSSCSRRTSGRCRTPSTASPTSRPATASAISTC